MNDTRKVVQAMRLGEMHQLVRVEGVAGERPFELEVEAFTRRGLRHAAVHLHNLLGREPVLVHQHLAPARRRVARRRRVQLKRTMHDLHVVAVLVARERLLEAACADVAPRTDEVGPDIDAHRSIFARRRAPADEPSSRRWRARSSSSTRTAQSIARFGRLDCGTRASCRP